MTSRSNLKSSLSREKSSTVKRDFQSLEKVIGNMTKSKISGIIHQAGSQAGGATPKSEYVVSPVSQHKKFNIYDFNDNQNDSGINNTNKSRSKIHDTEYKTKTAAKQASSLLQTKLNNARASGKSKIEDSHLNNVLETEVKVATKDYRLPKPENK